MKKISKRAARNMLAIGTRWNVRQGYVLPVKGGDYTIVSNSNRNVRIQLEGFEDSANYPFEPASTFWVGNGFIEIHEPDGLITRFDALKGE